MLGLGDNVSNIVHYQVSWEVFYIPVVAPST